MPHFSPYSTLQILLEAIPKDETDQARAYRGYIAVDDVTFQSGDKCRGHCNFAAGLCEFTNSDRADFNWKVVSEGICCRFGFEVLIELSKDLGFSLWDF